MRDITVFLNEAAEKEWVAISVTTAADHYHSKDSTSQRVVSYDTYREMQDKGRTKGYMTIKHIEKLSPICKSKEVAMEYIDVPQKKMKKGKIDKKGADYIVWCISSGSMNPSGKTKWDWNLWDEQKDAEIYMGDYGRSFLFGAPGSLKVGDTLFCVDNDTQKKLAGAPKKVEAVCKCNLEDFRKVYRETYPDCCKSPKRAFGKVSDGLPWTNRMGQFYSIKGVAEEA
jgi:hypothetical protein